MLAIWPNLLPEINVQCFVHIDDPSMETFDLMNVVPSTASLRLKHASLDHFITCRAIHHTPAYLRYGTKRTELECIIDS